MSVLKVEIMVANRPIMWKSAWHSGTDPSTIETEIIALVHSCCKVFPIMDGVSIMGKAVGFPVSNTTIKVLNHKDNVGALVLAKISTLQFTSWSKHYHTILFGFKRRLWGMGSSCLRSPLLSNSGIYLPKEYLKQDLNISVRQWWDGNYVLHWLLRGIVDGHFGCYLFCLNLHEKGK